MKRKSINNSRVLPPLDYLLAFERSAKLGSFAAASREMNVSETAISRKVKLLEQHYNTSLFVRGHRSITLTPQGYVLLDPVCQSLDKIRNASQQMFSTKQLNTVNLSATNSVASLWLMPRLHKFNALNGRVKINLVSSDNDKECLGDNMDIAILRGEGEWLGFTAKQLFGETTFPVCTQAYLDANPNAASLITLPDTDLIEVESAHTEWMTWREWFSKNGIDQVSSKRTTRFNTYPLSVQAAVDGLGVAMGWRHLVDPHLESGALIKPLGDTCVRTQSGYYLLKPEGKKNFPELEIVENWLIGESERRTKFTDSMRY